MQEYDLAQFKTQLNQVLIGVGFMAFLHFKFGYIRPIIIQTVLGLKNAVGTPLFKVYLFKKPAVGDLARPWRPANPFG